MEPSKKPLNVIVKRLNSYIAVVLKNGVEYRGTMVQCDGHMNLILDGATEYVNGETMEQYSSVGTIYFTSE